MGKPLTANISERLSAKTLGDRLDRCMDQNHRLWSENENLNDEICNLLVVAEGLKAKNANLLKENEDLRQAHMKLSESIKDDLLVQQLSFHIASHSALRNEYHKCLNKIVSLKSIIQRIPFSDYELEIGESTAPSLAWENFKGKCNKLFKGV